MTFVTKIKCYWAKLYKKTDYFAGKRLLLLLLFVLHWWSFALQEIVD